MVSTNRPIHPPVRVVFTHYTGSTLSVGNASSAAVAADADVGIGVIVDCKQQPINIEGAEMLHFPLRDDVDGLTDLDALADLLGKIDSQLLAGRSVHVVCAMGLSRSVTVATNYVAAVLGIEFREALALVRYTHSQAAPNPGFYDVSQANGDRIGAKVNRFPVPDSWLHRLHLDHTPANLVKLMDLFDIYVEKFHNFEDSGYTPPRTDGLAWVSAQQKERVTNLGLSEVQVAFLSQLMKRSTLYLVEMWNILWDVDLSDFDSDAPRAPDTSQVN